MKKTRELRSGYIETVIEDLRQKAYLIAERDIPQRVIVNSKIKQFFEDINFRNSFKIASEESDILKRVVDDILENKNIKSNLIRVINERTDPLLNVYEFYENSTDETNNQIDFVVKSKSSTVNPNRIKADIKFKSFLEDNKKQLENKNTSILETMEYLRSHGLLIRNDNNNKNIPSLFTSPLLDKYYRNTFPIYSQSSDYLEELEKFMEKNIKDLDFLELFESDEVGDSEQKYYISSLETALDSEIKNLYLNLPMGTRLIWSKVNFKNDVIKLFLSEMKEMEVVYNLKPDGIKDIVIENIFNKIFENIFSLKKYLPALTAITNKNTASNLNSISFQEKQTNFICDVIRYHSNKKIDHSRVGQDIYDFLDVKTLCGYMNLVSNIRSESDKDDIFHNIVIYIFNSHKDEIEKSGGKQTIDQYYSWLQKPESDFLPYEKEFIIIKKVLENLLEEQESYLLNEQYSNSQRVFDEKVVNSKSITFNMNFMRIFLNVSKGFDITSSLNETYDFSDINDLSISNNKERVTMTLLGENVNLATEKEMSDLAIQLGKLHFKQGTNEDLISKIRELQLITTLRSSEIDEDNVNQSKKEYVRKKI